MRYVDGYVLPVPKKRIKEYAKLAKVAAKVWKDHGALDYYECVGDDLKPKWGVPFPKVVKLKPGDTLVFAFIVYKSRADRDKINAKVMQDPRIASMDPKKMPVDPKRMLVGGFKVLVQG
jgi:uncharacterized protein YbaA (DUF1428 family)